MPRTPSATARLPVSGPRICVLGAAVILLAAGCSGGGGGADGPTSPGTSASASGDLGSSPPVEGGSGQPTGHRSSAGGNGGGFNAAGQVSPDVSGSGRNAVVNVTNISKGGPLTVTVSQVTDCTGTGGKVTATASPSSLTKAVAVGPAVSFIFLFGDDSAGSGDRKVCAKVSVNGSTITTSGTVNGTGSPDTGSSNTSTGRATGSPRTATGSANGGSTATAKSTP